MHLVTECFEVLLDGPAPASLSSRNCMRTDINSITLGSSTAEVFRGKAETEVLGRSAEKSAALTAFRLLKGAHHKSFRIHKGSSTVDSETPRRQSPRTLSFSVSISASASSSRPSLVFFSLYPSLSNLRCGILFFSSTGRCQLAIGYSLRLATRPARPWEVTLWWYRSGILT